VLFALIQLLMPRALRLAASSASELHNDIEIMVLRQQLAVRKRQVGRPRLRRRDRPLMATLSRVLPRPRWSSLVVSPQTLLRWHRELVGRKWTHYRNATGGRSPLADDVRALILRMGRENPRWGACGSGASWPSSGSGSRRRQSARSRGRSGLCPAPRRSGPTWREFLSAQAEGILATTASPSGSIWLRTLYGRTRRQTLRTSSTRIPETDSRIHRVLPRLSVTGPSCAPGVPRLCL
jgi:putative transposase